MVIGGLQKNSFIDYPGKISTVIFLPGCNFTCPYCHNVDLAQNHPSLVVPEPYVLDFLNNRRNLIEGVVISGGEPTLAPELPVLCRQIKNMGYPVKLDTNGSRPDVLKKLINDRLVDYIAMDIKTDLEQYHRLWAQAGEGHDIKKSVDLLMSAKVPFEFRTTCVSPFISLENTDKIGQLIQGAPRYYLQKDARRKGSAGNGRYPVLSRNDMTLFQKKIAPYVAACTIRP